tara:strand:- start:21 stop:437 length:417 start_codon:yes stop_codon:yes gene_type:complete
MATVSVMTGDLFALNTTGTIVHCISKDKAMGKGFAVHMTKRFGKPSGDAEVGGLIVQKHEATTIFHLVTKERYFHKPTNMTLGSSLVALREYCVENGIHTVAMPAIGTGLDKLKRDDVQILLHKELVAHGISVRMYVL